MWMEQELAQSGTQLEEMSTDPRNSGKPGPYSSRVGKRVTGQISVLGRSHVKRKDWEKEKWGVDTDQH